MAAHKRGGAGNIGLYSFYGFLFLKSFTCYLLLVTCYLLLVTCYLFPVTLSKKPGSGSYRFRFIPVPVHTGSRLTEPGSTVPGKVHKFHGRISTASDGCDTS